MNHIFLINFISYAVIFAVVIPIIYLYKYFLEGIKEAYRHSTHEWTKNFAELDSTILKILEKRPLTLEDYEKITFGKDMFLPEAQTSIQTVRKAARDFKPYILEDQVRKDFGSIIGFVAFFAFLSVIFLAPLAAALESLVALLI